MRGLLDLLRSTWMWWAPPIVLMLAITLGVMWWLGYVHVPGPDYAVF